MILLASFTFSFVTTFLLIQYQHLHGHYTSDSDILGPQKVHTNIVPRIGGISIAIGLLIGELINLMTLAPSTLGLTLLLCSIPVFLAGLGEDITKNVGIITRLLFGTISGIFFIFLTNGRIQGLDVPFLDPLFTIPGFVIFLTVFAIVGLINAFNIIDGFNGLASLVGAIILAAITVQAYRVNDTEITYLGLMMITAILGFFYWNYPRGLIFLGDGGAYLIGFWIASLSVLLVYRNAQISPWFALVINGYPIVETIFSIYRRKIHRGKNPGSPDRIHFHSLIYRRIIRQNYINKYPNEANAKTSMYSWALTIACILPALIWPASTYILGGVFGLFVGLYIWIYSKIVRFKTPRWLV